jgi:hypothetical protein
VNDTQTIETRLAKALQTPMHPADLARLDERIAAALQVRSLTRPGRAIGRKPVLVLAGLLVVVLAAAASGGLRTTESPSGLADASAFQAEIDAAKAVVPLPAGATWPPTTDVPQGSGSYSAGGGRSAVEGVAFCLWTKTWIAASASGDTASAGRALAVLQKSRAWTSYSGPFSDQSYRDIVDGIVSGAAAGNTQPARRFVSLNCVGL